MMLGPGNAGRQMGENKIVPVVMRDQPIGGCERDALLPFLGRNPVPDAGR